MTQINAYLTFGGNCREAMRFYQQCLGGELTIQTVGESPAASEMPEHMKGSVLHSTLVNDTVVIMASDMVGDQGLVKGNSVSLMINCSNEDEIYALYSKLSAGGHATYPVEPTFWGALFGNLVDKYGNQWLLHCNTSA